MRKTLKVLSALLTYPTAELKEAAAELRGVIAAESGLPAKQQAGIDRLLAEFEERDLLDLQERYILLFDRTRSLSLHLFEHVHGESRDRGQAMVDLQRLYESHGFTFASTELPDFLPMFLEFASVIPDSDARDLLSETVHIFEALRQRLQKRKSAYEAVFRCLQTIAKSKPDPAAVKAMLSGPDPDANDLKALDAAWEEEEVRFGPAASECGHEGLAAKMRAGNRPAPGVAIPERQATVFTHSPSNRA